MIVHHISHIISNQSKNKQIIIYLLGSGLNPAPDNTRFNPSSGNRGYDNRYAGNQPPIDPNTIFGAPNRQPALQPNHGYNHIFPNPSNPYGSYPQQSGGFASPGGFAQAPYPFPPQNPGSNGFGRNPYHSQPQQPYAFGNPPRMYGPSTGPGLFDQFFNNKQTNGRRRNSGTQILPSNIIYIISICNVLIASVITFRWDRH